MQNGMVRNGPHRAGTNKSWRGGRLEIRRGLGWGCSMGMIVGIYEALLGEGGNVCPLSFKTCHFTYWRGSHVAFWYFIIFNCSFLCGCRSFSPSLYHLSPFLLSNVAVSSSCHLSEFVFSMASFINSNESFFLYDCVLCPPFFFRVVLLCLFELLFRGPNRPRNG